MDPQSNSDAVCGGARWGWAKPVLRPSEDTPLEAVEKHARTIQSWLDVQRARGGLEETAKAFLLEAEASFEDKAQRRLHEAKEAQAQKQLAKKLLKEEKTAKARKRQLGVWREAEAAKAKRLREARNKRRCEARAALKKARARGLSKAQGQDQPGKYEALLEHDHSDLLI